MVTSYIQAYEKNVDIQNREIAFDKRLREKSKIKQEKTAQERHKFQKKWLSVVVKIVMIFYLLLIPLFMAPPWCLNYYRGSEYKKQEDSVFLLDCQKAYSSQIVFSNIPKVYPIYSCALDVNCMLYLCVYRFLKDSWTESLSRRRKIHNWIFTIVSVISMADVIFNTVRFEYAYLNNLLRPFIAILFFSSIRTNLLLIWHDFRDSFLILCTIFAFILFFAALALFMFQGTFSGS